MMFANIPPNIGLPSATELARSTVALALHNIDRLVSFGYDLAKINRRTQDWIRPHTSANAETYDAGEVPADSAHDLVRNNPIAFRARQEIGARVIGRGLTPVAAPEWTALFQAWAKNCYVSNRSNFARIQTLALEAMVESGEVYIRRRWRRTTDLGWDGMPLALPFQLQVLEAAQVDRLKDGPAPDGGKYIQGHQFDAIGRPVAVWFYLDHPGERVATSGSYVSTPVEYADLIHLYREDRPGQTRGTTWYCQTGNAIRKLGQFEDTELTRKNFEACTVNWIYNETGEEPEVLDDAGNRLMPATRDSSGRIIERPAPGQNVYVPAGYKVQPHTPQAIQGYSEFMTVGERHVAEGWGLPHYALSGDLSQVNYSSARIGDVTARAWISPFQEQVIVPLFLDVIARWVTEAAIATSKLRGPVSRWVVEWQAPAVEEHNRLEACQADEAEVRCGFNTLARVIRARGWEPNTTLDEREKEVKDCARRGLRLDSDPNTTTRSGAIQPAI